MNLFNRIFTMTTLLLLTIAAAGVLLVFAGLLPAERVGLGGWVQGGLGDLERIGGWTRALGLATAALVTLAGLMLVQWEIQTLRPTDRRLVIRDESTGTTSVGLTGLGELLSGEVRRIEGVRSANAVVVPSRRGLRVTCDVDVAAETSLALLTPELESRLRSTMEQHIGMDIGRLDVRARTGSQRTAVRPRIL